MSDSWQAVAAEHVRALGLDPGCLDVLRAFDSPGEVAPPVGDLRAEARAAGESAGALGQRIARLVAEEVDVDQARMFARRFLAVDRALGSLGEGEALVLRVGLCRRMGGILGAPGPRVLRVRACVDFYAGHGALLSHRHRLGHAAVPSLSERARAATWIRVAPGVEHALLEGDTPRGPVHINLLRCRRPRLEVVEAWSRGGDLVDLVRREGAVAGLSGGFFLYSETDITPPARRHDPVALLVSGGQLLSPPVLRRGCLLQDVDGQVRIERVGPVGFELRWEPGVVVCIAACNEPGSDGPCLYNRAWGEVAPPAPWALSLSGLQVVEAGPGALPIPLAGGVLTLDAAPSAPPTPGQRLTWTHSRWPRIAVAGGPMLVRGGTSEADLVAEDFAGSAPPVTFSQDETFDQNLLPRMALGLTGSDDLIVAAVDGRHLERAPGLTLRETGDLLSTLGCHAVVNMDGGSSKRLVVGGRQVDLATTEVVTGAPGRAAAPSRPVHTAVLVYSR